MLRMRLNGWIVLLGADMLAYVIVFIIPDIFKSTLNGLQKAWPLSW